MNKILLITLLGTLPFFAFSQGNVDGLNDDDKAKIKALQDRTAPGDTIWKFGGTASLNFSQAYFSNWASGGQNSISGTAFVNGFAKYAKGRNSWDNSIDVAYGMQALDKKDPIKTDDKIDLTSKYGYQLKNPHWYYSALFNFRSQFAPGYEIEDGEEVGQKISDFFAPAYMIFSLGMDYKPNDNFSALLSPLTSKITIVNDDRLAPDFGLDPGDNVRFELGAFVKLTYQKDIFENVNLLTKLDLFSNYADNPQNVDVNWETLISMKINSWLSASIATQLVYDDDIMLVTETREVIVDGEPTIIEKRGPRTQFKEVFALGLSVKF